MYYSVTFTMNNIQKNTWADWRMIPASPPMIPAPEMNLNYVDIPGRVGGPLDLTGVPFNRNTYKRMSGSWTFYREVDNRRTRVDLYEEILAYFTGKVGKVKLEEDLDHYYKGRFTVGLPKSTVGPMQIVIAYDLEPLRYNSDDDSIDTTYAPQ